MRPGRDDYGWATSQLLSEVAAHLDGVDLDWVQPMHAQHMWRGFTTHNARSALTQLRQLGFDGGLLDEREIWFWRKSVR